MQLYNFEGTSIRCRKAKQLVAGPGGGEKGWFVGKTMRAAQLGSCWWNGVLIGVADTTYGRARVDDGKENDFNVHGGGVCGEPTRIIQRSDVLIFVSPTSAPGLFTGSRTMPNFKLEAKGVMQARARGRRGGVGPAGQAELIESQTDRAKRGAPQHVLLCGWRTEWEVDVNRFKQRFVDISVGLSPGSSVTCLNVMPSATFASLLVGSRQGFEACPGPGGGFILNDVKDNAERREQVRGVVVRHHQGDPIKFDDVSPLLAAQDFDTAIVLGSVVGKVIPAASRDARVLSCLLILRALAKPDKPMHVIAENTMDQTSGLAVVPSTIRSGGGHEPDFINTQAIIARCLVMNLAYPQIQDALSELIAQDGVVIDFVAPADLGIEGLRVSFGAVQYIVCAKEVVDGYAVAIGYFNGAALVMVPDPALYLEWSSSFRVVIIVRDVTPDLPSGDPGDTTGAERDEEESGDI
jgi:hypothetical protein